MNFTTFLHRLCPFLTIAACVAFWIVVGRWVARVVLVVLVGVAGMSVACVSYTGPDGTRLTMMGTNAESLRAGGLSMENVNQAEGIQVAGEALKEIIRIRALFGLAEAGVEAASDVADSVIDAATN